MRSINKDTPAIVAVLVRIMGVMFSQGDKNKNV